MAEIDWDEVIVFFNQLYFTLPGVLALLTFVIFSGNYLHDYGVVSAKPFGYLLGVLAIVVFATAISHRNRLKSNPSEQPD